MAKLYWSGDVGWRDGNGSGITVESVKADLDALAGADLEVELTTLGGDLFQGISIMNLVRDYPGKKKLWLSGIVASAGTVIAMGFDEIIARTTSMWMIHNAQSVAFGDHNDMREAADLYEGMSDTIAKEYVARTGKPIEEIKAWMDAETWFMGQEIVDAGFADSMETDASKAASSMLLISAQNQFRERVTMWAKMPRDTRMEDKSMRASMANAEKLIKAGEVDKTSPWKFSTADADALLGDNGDDWATYKLWHVVQDDALPAKSKERYKYPYGKDGKVYRSALRAIASRAATQGLTDVSDWASAQIKAIDAKGENRVNKEQVLAWLKDNPGCAAEVAAVMGLKLVDNSITAAVELKAKLDAENIADPMAEIKRLRGELEAVDGDKVKNALDAAFGAEKDVATGVVNDLRVYAGEKMAGVKSADLSAKLTEFKKSPLAVKLAGERMDANSNQNVFGLVDGAKSKADNKVKLTVAGVEIKEV